MKTILSLVFFSLLTTVAFPQEKPVSGGGVAAGSLNKPVISFGLTDEPGTKALNAFVYELDLLPGQVCEGWYYFWSVEGTLKCNFKETPEANWVSISPRKFTSTGCSNIIPVKVSLNAPVTEGTYEATLKDSLSHWSDFIIHINVTRKPTENTITRRIGIYTDSVVYEDNLMHYPMNFSNNTCVSYYFPGDSMKFNFQINPPSSWLKISPMSGRIYKNELEKYLITVKKRVYDSTWVTLSWNYHSPELYYSYVKTVVPKEGLLRFNGTNYINTGYYPNSSTKTLMYWVRFDEVTTAQAFGVHDMEDHRFYLGLQANNRLLAGLGNGYTPVTDLNLVAGRWYHMAMTTSADNDSAKVYINGTEVSRFPFIFSGKSKSNFLIGCRNDYSDYTGPVKGYIEEVQVWEKPLTRNKIINYMFNPPVGNENGLIINYTFSEGWGDFTRNLVKNNYSGMFEDHPEWIDNIKRPANMSELITSVEEFSHNSENTISLTCKPNPFTSATEINYNLVGTGKALLELYDIRGVRIRTLKNENMINGAGNYNLNDATLPAGIYYVRLIVTGSEGTFYKSIKLVKTD